MYRKNPLCEMKLRKAIDSGKLSAASIKRLRDAGMIPSYEKFNDGVYRGAVNMLKKNGIHITHIGNKGINSFAIPGKITYSSGVKNTPYITKYMNVANIPKHPSNYPREFLYKDGRKIKIKPAHAAILSWHEGREASRAAKSLSKEKDLINDVIDSSNRIYNPVNSFLTPFSYQKSVRTAADSRNIATNGHNLGVLSDEKKLLNSYKKRYGSDPGIALIDGKKFRRNEEELKQANSSIKNELKLRKQRYKNTIDDLNNGIIPADKKIASDIKDTIKNGFLGQQFKKETGLDPFKHEYRFDKWLHKLSED